MSKQNPLTLLTNVKPDRLNELNAVLENIRQSLQAGTDKEFKKLSTVHYCRWFILQQDSFRDETVFPVPVRLVFSSNYDGEEDNHLKEICTVFTKYLDQMYACCEGYPDALNRTTESRANFLKQCGVKTDAFYIGAPGRTLKQIFEEDELRDHIWEFINKHNWNGKSALEIHEAIRQDVDSRSGFAWSKQKVKIPSVSWVGMGLLAIVMIILLPVLIIWLLIVHFFYERSDVNGAITLSQLDDAKVRRLEEDEDLFDQNQFTQAVVMKSGAVRLITVHALKLFARKLIGNLF